MPLVIAGIDEAGYGPTLGPLCVAATVLRLEDWDHGDAAPDFWSVLSAGVCRKPADKRARIAVDDSKKLKGPNDRTTRHPLADLERGVLTFLSHRQETAAMANAIPASDTELFERVYAVCEPHPWYAGEPAAIPLGGSFEQLGIAANMLGRCLAGAGVSVLDLRCRAIGEAGFNRIIERTGTKSAATGAGVTRHLRTIWNRHALLADTCEGGVRLVCDAQGGRTDYFEYLRVALPGARVSVLEQSAVRSRYLVEGDAACPISDLSGQDGVVQGEAAVDGARAMTITFMPEADSAHFTVALASMLAKLVRELMMQRFNRYWSARIPELKPTAGYALDARRWLSDVGPRASAAERATLIRRA